MAVSIWTFTAEGRQVAVDEAGVVPRKDLVGEPELFSFPWLVITQDYIGGRRKTLDQLSAFPGQRVGGGTTVGTIPDVEPWRASGFVSLGEVRFGVLRSLFRR